MKKRLIKKIAKRLGLWPAFIHRPLEAHISVTKIDVPLTSLDAKSEEPVADIVLKTMDVETLAKKARKWITDGRFVASPSGRTSNPVDCKNKTLFKETDPNNLLTPIWFIGDLHGDLAALKILTEFARTQNRRDGLITPTRLFFLGDFTDDAPFSAEIVAWVMNAWETRPLPGQQEPEGTSLAEFNLLAVAGNHDDGLSFVEGPTGGKFVSSVSPSTFAEELNDRMMKDNTATWKNFGLAAIEFFNTLPRMVILDKTVMVAHGGVPHTDVVIENCTDLDSPQALSDFVWNRLHETAPKKVPNRESHGSQQGVKDFESFIASLENATDVAFAPKVFIRGHDHHDGNFKRYENYKGCSVLTLNAFTVNRGSFGQKYRDLALLRWVPSEPDRMTLFRFKFQDKALEQIWRALLPEKRIAKIKGDKE